MNSYKIALGPLRETTRLLDPDFNYAQGRRWPGIVTAIVYTIVAVGLPLYNKYVLGSPSSTGGFKFPLTLTWLQLSCVAVLLGLVAFFRRIYIRKRDSHAPVPRIARKQMLLLIIPSLLFAANIALTNVGLFMMNVTAHLALRNSEIVWVVVFACIFRSERPTIWHILCVAVIAAGVILTSMFVTTEDPSSSTLPSLMINLSSAIAAGLQYVTLRVIVASLRDQDPALSIVEVSAVKIGIAALFVMIPMLALEIDGFPNLGQAPTELVGVVIAGIFITLIFQASVVAMAWFTKATTAGVISQIKLVPQVILSVVLFRTYFSNAMVISGIVLVVVGCVAYAVVVYILQERLKRKETSIQTVL